jgi:pilus assembly protein Flp/PilA
MLQLVKSFWQEEEGVTAIEYGLIAALIEIVIVGGVTAAGLSLDALFQRVADCVAAPTVANCT